MGEHVEDMRTNASAVVSYMEIMILIKPELANRKSKERLLSHL